jgi:hypothetical protein
MAASSSQISYEEKFVNESTKFHVCFISNWTQYVLSKHFPKRISFDV